jgi:hypothetical protein
MADPSARRVFDDAMRTSAFPACEAARVAFAERRMRRLEDLERRLLASAVASGDDIAARWLELGADTAWRDARAIGAEHALEPAAYDEEEP